MKLPQEKPITECKFCDKPTPHLKTRMCDNCWEVYHRIGSMPLKILNKIVMSARHGKEPR